MPMIEWLQGDGPPICDDGDLHCWQQRIQAGTSPMIDDDSDILDYLLLLFNDGHGEVD